MAADEAQDPRHDGAHRRRRRVSEHFMRRPDDLPLGGLAPFRRDDAQLPERPEELLDLRRRRSG